MLKQQHPLGSICISWCVQDCTFLRVAMWGLQSHHQIGSLQQDELQQLTQHTHQ